MFYTGAYNKKSEVLVRANLLSSAMTHLIVQPSETRQYLPREMTTACPGPVLRRSPLMIAPLEMMVFPPRMMF